jgi:cytochrome P450
VAQAKLPPGPKGQFLIGNTLQYMRDPLGFLARAVHDYGDVVRLRLGNTTTYVLNHPKDVEFVLRTHHQNFIKDRLTRLITPVVGNGLLTSEGDFWRRQRKLAQPAFQLQQIQHYGEVMVALTERMLATWHDGQAWNIHEDLMGLTLGIVAKTLFDADVAGEAKDVGASLEVVMDYFLDPLRWFRIREWLPTPSTLRYRQAIRRLDEIIYGIIRRRRLSGHDPGDLLSRLLAAQDEEGGRMTDRQLRDEAVTLFLAGHETTALALSYGFYLLARHPEVESRLVAELEEVLGGRLPMAADVPNLRYTEWVIREVLRLYPPAWGIARETLSDCEIGGYHVPRGTQLFLIQWLIHQDPRWFDEPEAFRPERWANDLVKRLPRCTYFPFGDGPRICIGNHFALMEAVLILATIAQRYHLSLVPGQTLELVPSITLRPRHGIRMVAHSRQTAAHRA